MIIRPHHLLAFGALIFGAAPASAQSISSYADQVLSGINVTENGTKPGNSTRFGLNAGDTVKLGFGTNSGTYSLVDVREFALLLNTSTSPGISLEDPATLPGSAVIGGNSSNWAASSNAPILAWDSAHNGSNKNGQIKPGGITGNVFDLTTGQMNSTFKSFGFDIAVKIGANQSDPFGNNTAPGGISTGRVFENFSAPAVPEASTATGFMGVLMCGGVTLFRRRKSK